MGKQVLITSGVLHPCHLHSSWYFSYMRFSMNFQVDKSPLMTILDVFRGGPACYPGQQLVWWYGPKLLLSKFINCIIFWQGASIFGFNDPTYYPSFLICILLFTRYLSNRFFLFMIIIPLYIPCRKVKYEFVSVLYRGIPLVNIHFIPHRSGSSCHQPMLC